MGLTPPVCSASELKPELLCVKHRRDGKRYVHVIEGMANAKIPDIFETSMQDWDYPDGPTTADPQRSYSRQIHQFDA